MILIRALNEFDILGNPYKNGIASKKMIYELAKNYYNEMNLDKLKKDEKEIYMKKYIEEHEYKLEKMYNKKQLPITNTINSFLNEKNNKDYFKILMYISSLPNHLANGSRTHTEWISTTNNFDNVWKYYENQERVYIGIFDIPNNGFISEDTFVINVSNKDEIQNIKYISNRLNKQDIDKYLEFINENNLDEIDARKIFHKYILKPTDKKFMGFNFSSSSNEFDIYNYIKPDNIISIMEQLEIDYLRADLFNTYFLIIKPEVQKIELERLKRVILKNIENEHNYYMRHIFTELYINNKHINCLAKTDIEKEKINYTRNLILSKSLSLNSPIIKK